MFASKSCSESRASGLVDDAMLLERERERFKWFARSLSGSVGKYDLDFLRACIEEPARYPGQREKAVVLLALDDRPAAGTVLGDVDAGRYGEDFERLYKVAVALVLGAEEDACELYSRSLSAST